MTPLWLCLFFGLTTLVASSANSVFTNSFLVRFQQNIKNEIVHGIAARNGFENMGEVNIIKYTCNQIRKQYEVILSFAFFKI